MRKIALALSFAFIAATATAQQSNHIKPPYVVIWIWDCADHWVFKGWAINDGRCVKDGSKTPREVLDKYIASNVSFRGYTISEPKTEISHRPGTYTVRAMKAYLYTLTPPASAQQKK